MGRQYAYEVPHYSDVHIALGKRLWTFTEGIGEHKAGKLSEIVQLKKEIAKAESDLQALQKKMRKEPQLDRQMLMNKEVKTKRAEVEEMKRKLVELK